jgi:glycosidase
MRGGLDGYPVVAACPGAGPASLFPGPREGEIVTMRNDIRRLERAAPAPGASRRLHVALEARRRYRLAGDLFGLRGRMMFGDLATAYRLAVQMNEIREAGRFPELALGGSELYGAALLHELMHALMASASERAGSSVVGRATAGIRDALGVEALDATLLAFVERFPVPTVADGHQEAASYLRDVTEGEPNADVALEEALLLWLANANPALERLHELFDDGPLRRSSAYERALPLLEAGLRDQGPVEAGGRSLIDLLWAPQRRSPTSLEGQLRAAEELWGPILGERYAGLLARLLRSIDALHEERTRGPGGPGPSLVLDADALGRFSEIEAFSADSEWMPRVVLVAKSTYVWLAQLERRFGREVRRLDQIPDEALDELAGYGFNGLWLIGIWERSQASRSIKQRRGQPHALASAYALYDYVVASDLGGEPALRELESRAARRGIRLAGDMVPNHVGIDGKWVAEHPDWFLQLDHPPYAGYRFDGPDLSSHPSMAVMIEDHYWDGSDAAVVFKRVERATGETRYIYHGNDGTSMPWNDTAQLDYLNPEVREAVVQTILHVARTVPIIRFDAAMTLAKRHIQRLWFPPPGHGGAIPSRSAYGGMSSEEFERRLPVEFWREVVDRVAREAPGTLLLAEAFWMMEGYFVRTLGMHRVYNSAFMHMLKREENAEYRQLMKNVLEFDPRILGRFVNFMNNPDEETAIAQFGDGDKYFGVAILMATMPGLPMFGHGQVEGFREKYGMEYRAPTFEEAPDPRMVERHRRQIAPLLHRRAQFAPAETFRLFDVRADDGSVQEDVYAYTNRNGAGASLVLYNNRYPRAEGTIYRSVPFAEPWAGGAVRDEALHEALGVVGGGERYTILRERLAGLDYLRRSDDLVHGGFRVELDGFQARVFSEVREVRDQDGSYAGLHRQLAGAGVPDLEEARLDWSMREPRRAFLALLAASREGGDVPAAALAFVRAAREHGGLELRAAEPKPARARGAGLPGPAPSREAPGARGPVEHATPAGSGGRAAPEEASALSRDPGSLARLAAEAMAAVLGALSVKASSEEAGSRPEAGPPAGGEAPSSAGAPAVGEGWRDAASAALARTGVPTAEASAWGVAPALRAAAALTALQDGAEVYAALRLRGALESALTDAGVAEPWAAARLVDVLMHLGTAAGGGAATPGLGAVLREPAIQELLGVHVHGSERWFRQERYRLVVAGVVGQAAMAGASADALERRRAELGRAEEASGYRFDRLLDLVDAMAVRAAGTEAAPGASGPESPSGGRVGSRHENSQQETVEDDDADGSTADPPRRDEEPRGSR